MPDNSWDVEADHIEQLRHAALPIEELRARDFTAFPAVATSPPGQTFTLSELLAAGAVPVAPDDPMNRFEGAELIIGFDTREGEGFIFHGRELMAYLRDRGRLFPPEERPINVMMLSLDFRSRDLPYLVALTAKLRGACCYSPHQIPVRLLWVSWSI